MKQYHFFQAKIDLNLKNYFLNPPLCKHVYFCFNMSVCGDWLTAAPAGHRWLGCFSCFHWHYRSFGPQGETLTLPRDSVCPRKQWHDGLPVGESDSQTCSSAPASLNLNFSVSCCACEIKFESIYSYPAPCCDLYSPAVAFSFNFTFLNPFLCLSHSAARHRTKTKN